MCFYSYCIAHAYLLKSKEAKIMFRNKNLTCDERVEKFGHVINKLYRTTAPLLLAEALVFGAVAVLMMVKPIDILNAITFVVGGGLIVFGLYRTSMVFVSNLGFGIGAFDVFFGLVTMILGIVFCVYPQDAALGIIYVFIIMFLLNAFRMLFFAVNMARVGFEHYMRDLIAAGIMVLLSFVLLFLPNLAIGILVWFIAIYLLLYAALDVYMFLKLFRLRRVVRNICAPK